MRTVQAGVGATVQAGVRRRTGHVHPVYTMTNQQNVRVRSLRRGECQSVDPCVQSDQASTLNHRAGFVGSAR